jgi:hypothetical protein
VKSGDSRTFSSVGGLSGSFGVSFLLLEEWIIPAPKEVKLALFAVDPPLDAFEGGRR